MNDFAQIAPLQDDLETNEQRRKNVLARRNERKQAAFSRDSDDNNDDDGDSRGRKRSYSDSGDMFDGLLSDPSKKRKGRSAFERSQRNMDRKGKAKGKGRK